MIDKREADRLIHEQSERLYDNEPYSDCAKYFNVTMLPRHDECEFMNQRCWGCHNCGQWFLEELLPSDAVAALERGESISVRTRSDIDWNMIDCAFDE